MLGGSDPFMLGFVFARLGLARLDDSPQDSKVYFLTSNV